MKKILSVFSTSLLSFTILTGITGASHASSIISDEVEKFGFSAENKLDGDELAGLRGGLRVGSLNFDFAITSKTLVNGVLQHSTTITSAILEKNNALKDGMPSVAKIAANVLPENELTDTNIPVDISADGGSSDNGAPVDVAVNGGETPDNSSSSNPSGDTQPLNVTQNSNSATGVDVVISSDTLATTIQNSNDNAVIQQFNQLDVTVSNLSEVQKLNIAQQLDFQTINSIR